MEQKQNRIAPEAATDEALPGEAEEPASPSPPPVADRALTGFEPVPLRSRWDGLTPEKQREYVEALADCGVARHAAARIGVSEQAVARVRRRADARAFDLACEAAQRIGARRVRSIAWERAIEGTVRRHYYHGELKSEEIVYDNRLLVYLLGKTAHLAEPPAATQAVVDNWEPWMEAIEQGLPEPPAPEAAEPEPGEAEGAEGGSEPPAPLHDHICLWPEEGKEWTDFPPPAGFCGEEVGAFGHPDYRRTLSEMEQKVVDEWDACERERKRADMTADRDLFFGFAGGNADDCDGEDEPAGEAGFFSPREAETYETYEPSGRDEPGPAEPPESPEAGPPPARDEEPAPDRPRCEPRIRTL
jgi:hypothetical protein